MQDNYLIDKSRVRHSFGHAAKHYDAAAVLQREVCKRMLDRLDLIKLSPQRVLDAGSGTGGATRALAQRYPGSEVIALDFALKMLKQARTKEPMFKRLTGLGRGVQICGDLEQLPLRNACLDMVWSNLALQWCNDLDTTFASISQILRTDGLFMFSTFGPDTLKELRIATHQADPDVVHVSRFIDMHDIGDALLRNGFSAPVMDVEYFTLTYDDVFAVMHDLKAIGAHNATQGRRRGLGGKGFLQQITQRYEAFRREGKLPATFEVVYGHAWKSQPTAASSNEQIIRMHRRR